MISAPIVDPSDRSGFALPAAPWLRPPSDPELGHVPSDCEQEGHSAAHRDVDRERAGNVETVRDDDRCGRRRRQRGQDCEQRQHPADHGN